VCYILIIDYFLGAGHFGTVFLARANDEAEFDYVVKTETNRFGGWADERQFFRAAGDVAATMPVARLLAQGAFVVDIQRTYANVYNRFRSDLGVFLEQVK
jgi:hypothetical protein